MVVKAMVGASKGALPFVGSRSHNGRGLVRLLMIYFAC
jgi:hypothetical protein